MSDNMNGTGTTDNTGNTGNTPDPITQLKADFENQLNQLKRQNESLLNEKKSLQDKFKEFDPEELSRLKKVIESSEDAKLLSEGKIDDVINKRLERERLAFDEKYKTLSDQLVDMTGQRDKSQKRYTQREIDLSLSQEAIKQGIAAGAVPDVLARAQSVAFQIESDGTIVARDGDGRILTSKDGKAVTPQNFIRELEKSAPHLFKESLSAGLSGGTRSTGSSDLEEKLMAAAESGDMTKYRKIKTQMAKAAE